jgi:hypothetical protein
MMPGTDDKGGMPELASDAWERFKRAVDTVARGGPQHKKPTLESTSENGRDNVSLAGEGENGEVRNQKKRAQRCREASGPKSR